MAHSNLNGNKDILYRDDAGVVVTPVSLKVKNRMYPVEDIDRFAITKISANRIPGIIVTLLGIGVIAVVQIPSARNFISPFIPPLSYNDIRLSGLELVEYSGALVTVIGILMILLKRSLFTLSIVLGAETLDVTAHRKKKYIVRIAKAVEVAVRRRDRQGEQTPMARSKPSDENYLREPTKSFN